VGSWLRSPSVVLLPGFFTWHDRTAPSLPQTEFLEGFWKATEPLLHQYAASYFVNISAAISFLLRYFSGCGCDPSGTHRRRRRERWLDISRPPSLDHGLPISTTPNQEVAGSVGPLATRQGKASFDWSGTNGFASNHHCRHAQVEHPVNLFPGLLPHPAWLLLFVSSEDHPIPGGIQRTLRGPPGAGTNLFPSSDSQKSNGVEKRSRESGRWTLDAGRWTPSTLVPPCPHQLSSQAEHQPARWRWRWRFPPVEGTFG